MEASTKVISREINWQNSAHAFCRRLANDYASYEDVFVPIVNSIRSIQKGLRELCGISSVITQNEEEAKLEIIQRELLQFPIAIKAEEIGVIVDLASVDFTCALEQAMAAYFGNHKGILLSQAKALAKQCKMALLFSFLSRCELLFRLKRGNLGRSFFESVKFAFDELLKNWDSKDLANTALEENITTSNGETRINDAEKEEFLYRQYFPNHAQEFLDIMQSVDISEGYTSVATKSDDEMPFTFSANHLLLLCSLHRTLFSESVSDVDDACRIRSFKWGYQACCQIAPALEWFEQHNLRFENVGGHIMGLAMSSAISKGRLSSHVWNQSSCKPEVFSIDFNNDPNPAEVIKAEPLLCKLLLRVVQLLRAFPGNAILFTVKQVIERVCQLNFDEVPVGKVLKGLECEYNTIVNSIRRNCTFLLEIRNQIDDSSFVFLFLRSILQ